jgi:hypothetical protein
MIVNTSVVVDSGRVRCQGKFNELMMGPGEMMEKELDAGGSRLGLGVMQPDRHRDLPLRGLGV